jgi:hypothetical protein
LAASRTTIVSSGFTLAVFITGSVVYASTIFADLSESIADGVWLCGYGYSKIERDKVQIHA